MKLVPWLILAIFTVVFALFLHQTSVESRSLSAQIDTLRVHTIQTIELAKTTYYIKGRSAGATSALTLATRMVTTGKHITSKEINDLADNIAEFHPKE